MRVTLALFSNDNGQEYVVIVTDDTSYDEHAEPGYTVRAEWTMDVSESTITMFPTDRPLRANE